MQLIIKTENGVVERFPTEGKVGLIEVFISFILSESNEDIKFIKTLPLIAHIDPYADTYINSTQAPIYIEEFEKVIEYTKEENLKTYCHLVVDELKKLQRCNFLVFSGD